MTNKSDDNRENDPFVVLRRITEESDAEIATLLQSTRQTEHPYRRQAQSSPAQSLEDQQRTWDLFDKMDLRIMKMKVLPRETTAAGQVPSWEYAPTTLEYLYPELSRQIDWRTAFEDLLLAERGQPLRTQPCDRDENPFEWFSRLYLSRLIPEDSWAENMHIRPMSLRIMTRMMTEMKQTATLARYLPKPRQVMSGAGAYEKFLANNNKSPHKFDNSSDLSLAYQDRPYDPYVSNNDEAFGPCLSYKAPKGQESNEEIFDRIWGTDHAKQRQRAALKDQSVSSKDQLNSKPGLSSRDQQIKRPGFFSGLNIRESIFDNNAANTTAQAESSQEESQKPRGKGWFW